MMKVLIIAALVLVAHCQLQAAPRPGHIAHEGHRRDEGKVDTEIALTLPRLPEEISRMNLRQYEYYTAAKSEGEKGGRQEDAREAAFIGVVRNEAFDQLIQRGQEDPLKDPKNNAFLVNFLVGLMSGDRVNLEDPKLITPEGLVIKSFKDKEMRIRKDARSGLFTLNDIRAVRKEIPGNDKVLLMILDDFFTEDKEGIIRLTQRKGRVEERKIGDEVVIGQPGQERGRGVEGQVAGQERGQRN